MRSQSKDTGQSRKLWAWVGSGASIGAGSGGLRVTKTGTGSYKVSLDRAQSGAYGAAATANYGGAAFAVVSGLGSDGVTINTYTSASTLVDSNFTVEITLP
jgi:hypothetical protein